MKPMKSLLSILVLSALPAMALANPRVPGPPPLPVTRPSILNKVTVDQNLGAMLPLDLSFTDDTGKAVKLADYFNGGRPILLTPVYYKCPSLCNVTLNQLTRSLNAMTESAGKEFDVVAVSFDPSETPQVASDKKNTYVRAYRRDSAAQGLHFLTGPSSSIDPLMQAIGFHYAWDAPNNTWAHAATVIVVSPQGKIIRYFLGVDFPPTELIDALKLASAETVGARTPEVFLYCFKYDPATGKYGLIISRALKVGGVLTVLSVMVLMFSMTHVRNKRLRSMGITNERDLPIDDEIGRERVKSDIDD